MALELKHFRQVNWCLRGFLLPFVTVFASFLIAAITTALDYNGSPNEYQGKFWVGLLALVGLLAILGYGIYKKYIGPRVCARGWNEYSYLRGLQMTLLTFLVLWILPVATLIVSYQVYKFIAG